MGGSPAPDLRGGRGLGVQTEGNKESQKDGKGGSPGQRSVSGSWAAPWRDAAKGVADELGAGGVTAAAFQNGIHRSSGTLRPKGVQVVPKALRVGSAWGFEVRNQAPPTGGSGDPSRQRAWGRALTTGAVAPGEGRVRSRKQAVRSRCGWFSHLQGP